MKFGQSAVFGAVLVAASVQMASGQTVDPAFATNYSAVMLGQVPLMTELGVQPSIPAPYGGISFLNSSTILIGGTANNPGGAIYQANVIRDAEFHITGFEPATLFASAANIDGGLSFAPNGVLMYTTFSTNTLAQIKPGSTAPDKIIDLTPLGIAASTGTLAFVPTGQPGAGRFKIASYSTGFFYDVVLAPDANGTYDITSVGPAINIGRGPEGLLYVPAGSPLFPDPAMLVSEYGTNTVGVYDIDANGDPIPASRRQFLSGLNGAEGAVTDPFTGDFLFSTFGVSNQVVRVSGFAAVPEPSAAVTILAGLPLVMRRRR